MNTKFVNVIDLECTCWPDRDTPGADPAPMEIIEIGIAQVDVKAVKDAFFQEGFLPYDAVAPAIKRGQIFVTPQFGTVSEFCTKLTGITQETVDNAGCLLNDACKILRKEWKTHQYPWVSWGDFDRNQFIRECKMKNVPYPFGPTHINAKQLFAVKMGMDKGVGESEALKRLGWQFEGRPHVGADDAFNSARLFIHTMWG